MQKFLIAIISIFISFSFVSCVTAEENHDVYVTVYPLKYVAEHILEGTEHTVGIVPGFTSHENSVDWSPKEIIAMTEATYLFYVGGNYDIYIDYQINSIFTNNDVELVKIEDQSSYIEFIEGIIHTDEEEGLTNTLGVDPHFWVSPLKVQQTAALIYDKLKIKFEADDAIMRENYNNLVSDLQELSDAFAETIQNSDQIVMTSTNIYGYLREDYGLNYVSISPGYHEEAEQFTSQEKEEIVNHAIENNICYIIYEKYTSSPLSNAVYDELASLDMNPIKIEFNILQSLSDDEVIAGNDYITVMYENLILLRLALGYETE